MKRMVARTGKYHEDMVFWYNNIPNSANVSRATYRELQLELIDSQKSELTGTSMGTVDKLFRQIRPRQSADASH